MFPSFKAPGGTQQKHPDDLDYAIRQLVSQAIISDQVLDIIATAGLNKPDISILSNQFLADVRAMPHKNLAVEMLNRLLTDEIKTRARTNLIQSRSFAALLKQSIRAYQNRAVEAAQVIEELIALAKDIQETDQHGADLGITDDERAFYDALAANDSAVQVLSDDTLCTIARKFVEAVRKNITIDWAVKESARAKSALPSNACSVHTTIPQTNRSKRRSRSWANGIVRDEIDTAIGKDVYSAKARF